MNIAAYYQNHPIEVDTIQALDTSRYTGLITTIARLLHKGELKPEELHEPLIKNIYNDLTSAVDDSWPKRYQFGANAGADRTVLAMQRNLFRFSGAKTFAQLQEMNGLLRKDGQVRSWKDFKADALKINTNYNRNYLQAEFQTARQAAHHARDWQGHVRDKDLFPSLEYKTVGDALVRDEHNALNGIVRPVDDPFWDTYYPPNGWRCRCYVRPSEATAPSGATPKAPVIKPEFSGNVGKTGVVYADKHPYFAMAATGKKEAKTAFENSKKFAPYFTAYRYSGNTVQVSPFADPSDFKDNFNVAKTLVNNGISVKIRHHVELPREKNPEYEIEGKLAERKRPEKLNFKNVLRKANKQGAKVVVLDLFNNAGNLETAADKIRKMLRKKEAYTTIDRVIIVDGKKIVEVLRKKAP